MIAIIQERRSLLLGIGVICLALIITVILTIIRASPKPLAPIEPTPPTITIVTAEPQGHSPMVTATARAAAKYDINIVSRVSGTIENVEPAFSRGQQVSEGELLLAIDDLDYQTAYAQAKSNVAQAQQILATEKGSARQAKREWRDLGNEEANNLFLRKPQIAAASANLEAARANLKQAEANLERTKIKAPFSGQITDIKANLGQYVTAGSSMARLISTGHLEIAVPLTINEMARLNIDSGNGAGEHIQRDVQISYTSGFKKEVSTTGKLIRLDSIIDEESQVRFAIVEVKDMKTPIRVGELVNIDIPGNIYLNSMWVPEKALYERTQIMTVVDNLLTPRLIDLLDARDGQILVSGIETGMQIAIDRPMWAGPGTEVITQSLPAPINDKPDIAPNEQKVAHEDYQAIPVDESEELENQ